MSKAFTKENDDVPEVPVRRRGLPVPELNLVTPAGLAAARAELEQLTRTDGDADRIRELAEHLSTAQAADPPVDRGEVALGARVTIEDEQGELHVYSLVGAIEADPKRGRLSWQSPLAQALWGMRVGDGVTLPRGDGEIVTIEYP
ncbi:MAG: GreA/GreB family elongation factor [Myxococcales bacterium]|nr:GreA/GreB family elongation factor [Myxococcales bacterium]